MSKEPSKFIAFHKNDRNVLAIGTAKEVINEITCDYSNIEIQDEIEVYALGHKVKVHIVLTPELESAV